MLKIGITGSIGSGKTTVCQVFETLGIPVYYADARGKFLTEQDENVKRNVISEFGIAILGTDQKIDRSKLADVVFNNPEKLSILESIIHPAVFNDFNIWVSNQNSRYVLKEAALLFESGSYKELDKMITVTAPLITRIKRVQDRDRVTTEQIMSRENRQWPEADKLSHSDYRIINDGKQLILPVILDLHEIFSKLSNGK